MNNKYTRYYKYVARGFSMSPRGMETTARFNQTFEFTPGQYFHRQGANPAIGFAEGLQFIAGLQDKDAIHAAAPNVNLDLFGPTSFYGPRVRSQISRLLEDIATDRNTRRGVLMIAHPGDTVQTLPCTLSMQFYVQPDTNVLHSTVNMRSSDAVWGLPYDMIQFGMFHIAIATAANYEVGTCTVNMCNSHIYASHAWARHWVEQRFDFHPYGPWNVISEWAAAVVARQPNAAALKSMFNLTGGI